MSRLLENDALNMCARWIMARFGKHLATSAMIKS